MDKALKIKLEGMLWDMPASKRNLIVRQILNNPHKAFGEKEVLIRSLNTLNWYDLISILGSDKLYQFLTDDIISCLFPRQRQLYYKNAKKLLSKYSLSSAG